MKKAILALEDGVWFEGEGFGADGETFGEVVFNTGLSGYQEILTDPSYKGQMVCMTYPHIGNYGINAADSESARPWVEGFIIKELSPIVSNYRSEMTLDQYLKKYNILGIQGIDTRKLVKHLRTVGAKKAVISTQELDPKKLIQKAKKSPSIEGVDLVKEVMCQKPFVFDEVMPAEFAWGDQKKKKYKVSTLLILIALFLLQFLIMIKHKTLLLIHWFGLLIMEVMTMMSLLQFAQIVKRIYLLQVDLTVYPSQLYNFQEHIGNQ